MQEQVVQQNGLASLGFHVDTVFIACVSGLVLLRREVHLVDHAVLVAAGHDLHAAVFHCRRIEGGPNRHLWIRIQPPPDADVLVPGEMGAVLCRFVHEHGPEDGDVRTDESLRDLPEKRMLHVSQVERIQLQIVDAPICERLLAFLERPRRQLTVLARVRVALHGHAFVADLAQHDVVDAVAHYPQVFVGSHPA